MGRRVHPLGGYLAQDYRIQAEETANGHRLSRRSSAALEQYPSLVLVPEPRYARDDGYGTYRYQKPSGHLLP